MFTAVVNIPEISLVYSLDMYGNPQINQNDKYYVTLTNGGVVVNGVVTSVSNGVYQIQYTLVIAGTYAITIYLQPGGSGPQF